MPLAADFLHSNLVKATSGDFEWTDKAIEDLIIHLKLTPEIITRLENGGYVHTNGYLPRDVRKHLKGLHNQKKHGRRNPESLKSRLIRRKMGILDALRVVEPDSPVLDQIPPQQEGEPDFEYAGRVLKGVNPIVAHRCVAMARERTGPCGYLADASHRYRKQHGLPEPKVDWDSVEASWEKGQMISLTVHALAGKKDAPEVAAKRKRAYDDFKRQTDEMYRILTEELGVTVEVWDERERSDNDPYDTLLDQQIDLLANRHLWINRGEYFLGDNPDSPTGTDHPELSGHDYVKFRAVHDAFGHGVTGQGFDRHGEYATWLAHSSMYTGEGREAMSSEYHVINSYLWANNGRALPHEFFGIILPPGLIASPFDAKGNVVRKTLTGFALPELVVKHGNKDDPNYLKLHPNSKLARAARAAGRASKPAGKPVQGRKPDAKPIGRKVVGRLADPAGKRKLVKPKTIEEAVQAIAEGHDVEFEQPKEVSTLLDRLVQIADEAKAKGEKAPVYDLCRVSVKGTNLFCVETKGLPRTRMPQLKADNPVPGSVADGLKRDKRGEVDLTPLFRKHLVDKGVKITPGTEKASRLRASQRELNGAKVAGIARALEQGVQMDGALFVSRDNYIVDGHHRWAATVGNDLRDNKEGDLDMNVEVIDMSILHLLREANTFALENGIPPASVSKWKPKVEKVKKIPCRICGRPMSDPDSIRLGFGPTHLDQGAPAIKAKVDRLLAAQGITRNEAKFAWRHRKAGDHVWAGQPRMTDAKIPAQRGGREISGQVPFTPTPKPTAKPKLQVGDFVGIRHIGLDKRGKVVRVGRVNADVEVPIHNGKDRKIVRNVPIANLKPDPMGAFDGVLRDAKGRTVVPAKPPVAIPILNLADIVPGDRILNGEIPREYTVLENKGGGLFRVRGRLGAAGAEQTVELAVNWTQAFKNNQLVYVGHTLLKPKPKTPSAGLNKPKSFKTGDSPNIVVVEVDSQFSDDRAFEKFFEAKDDLGQPLFGRGHRLLIENDHKNPAVVRFIQMARIRGIRVVEMHPRTGMGLPTRMERRVNMLDVADRMIEQKKGAGQIVGFKPQGRTIGSPGDLIRRHIRRGRDTFGNPPEAWIIQEGWRDADNDPAGLVIGPGALPKIPTAGVVPPMKGRGQAPKKPKKLPSVNPAGKSPASLHLDSGGEVEDAPVDGLAEAMIRNTKRFTFRPFKNNNVSDTGKVLDNSKTPPKAWFLKKTAYGGGFGGDFMEYDILNEAVAGEIMSTVGGPGPRATFGTKPSEKKSQHYIVMEWTEEKFPGWQNRKGAGMWDQGHVRGSQYDNANEIVLTHLFDYLINQNDRHVGNYMTMEKNGRYKFIPVDNGGAFFAYGDARADKPYTSWAGQGKPQYVIQLVRDYAQSKDRDQVIKWIDEALDRLSQVDIRTVMERVENRNGKMTAEESDVMGRMMEMWRVRLAILKANRNQIITTLT